MPADPRKRIFIDKRVQGALVGRIVLYWFFSVIATSLILMWWEIAKGPEGSKINVFDFSALWEQCVAVGVASVLMLPVLIVDTLLLSGRFVGPVARLRSSMRALAKGKPVKPLDFRTRDLWQDIAQDFNGVVVYINLLRKQCEGYVADHAASPADVDDTLEPVAIS